MNLSKCMALLILGLAMNASAGFKPTIVGGGNAQAGEFPFIVSLQTNSMSHFCGGSLIKPNWVLTAAHCVEGGYIKRIYLGLYDQNDRGQTEMRRPQRIIRHPNYDSQTTDFDFALIELDQNSSFPPIEMNSEEITVPAPSEMPLVATVAGWGDTSQNLRPTQSANILQKVEVPLVSKEVCNQAYEDLITDRMICAGLPAGGKDSCYGDSGGPLTITDANGIKKLIGVVSWGEGCARPNKYGVYSKVSSVSDWIKQNIN